MNRVIILISGVGTSEKAGINLVKLANRLDVDYEIFNWQTEVEAIADPMIEKHCAYGTRTARWLRRKAWEFGFDGSGYEHFKQRTRCSLNMLYSRLMNEYDQIDFISHSWGTVVAYDFLKSIEGFGCTKYLATMATPLPFSNIDYDEIEGVDWINLWENSDVIAHKLLLEGAEDIQVKNGLLGISLLSHLSYGKSRKCAEIIKNRFKL